MTLALPMPEQTRPPDEKRLYEALIEFTAQQVEAAIAEWGSTDA